jgi:SEC-C motif
MARSSVPRNDPCPCGSGKKYKRCCLPKDVAASQPPPSPTITNLRGRQRDQPNFPIGTVALYGPDDVTTTKIAAGVITKPNAEPILRRWVATDVTTNPKIQQEIKDFFSEHGVKSVAACSGNMGCTHEEGEDFPMGEDCPFCPFWAGKQGSNRRD